MQANGRARSPNEPARFASRPIPPPLPARSMGNPAYGNGPSPETIDPKWLEDAVLRILEKHGKGSLVVDMREVRNAVHARRSPSRGRERAWRVARAALVLVAVISVSFLVARWRYPVKTAAVLGTARAALAHIPPPSSWMASIAPSPVAPVTAAPAMPATSAPEAKSMTSAAPPSVARPLSEAAAPSTAPAQKAEAKHAIHVAHAPHRAATTAPAAAPAAAPTADPVADAPPPIPGPLGEAIKRASGGRLVAPTSDRLAAPEAKPTADAALADRPAASLVNSALMGVLPDARACLSAGDDATHAVVVFESSGAVSSVQVSGPSASCIQKALGNARVPPFAQPTYRAGVPVRPR